MKKIIVLLMLVAIVSCKGGEANFPKRTDEARREKRGGGSLLDEGGLTLFGGGEDKEEALTKVDPILWKATLDTVSFMPLASVDSKGGVVVTDWHEMEKSKGERYKLNILVGNKLQVGGVKVSAFKQTLQNGNWRDSPVSKNFATAIEDKIFNNARKIKTTK